MFKKITFISSIIFASCSFADSGLYVGVGVGYGNMSNNTINGYNFLDGGSERSASSTLGSIYAGFDFNRYVGIQADYDYLSSMNFAGGASNNQDYPSSYSASQQVIALGVVGHLPFQLFANSLSGLSVFGRLSVGYSTLDFSGGAIAKPSDYGNPELFPGYAQSLVPLIGAGIEYGINAVGVRLEYNYIGNTTVNNNDINLINTSNNLALLSVLYHF